MPAESSERFVELNRLADEFAAQFRRGERPTVQDYAERHPELAAEIREHFPALLAVEQAKEDRAELPGESSPEPLPAFGQLGDFRVLREIGRGGMGVVYEVEQISLGRHVALKVLPRHILANARTRLRFEREAKAAARLHHTNIVPVFGIGEHDRQPFYVMQYIRGQPLDQVIGELKKLRQCVTLGPGANEAATPTKVTHVSAGDLARSLLTGTYRGPQDVDAPHPPREFEVAAVPRADSTSGVLPGQSTAAHGERRPTYWQSIAHLGGQVADALEYAHKQGIVHRDIKPSNLLLDSEGVVWVTDFGLAKVNDDHDLTPQGDVLGTPRYMPPEAYEGRSDPRSDVYSLGLTLYELVAFRPAFDEPDRVKLIKMVATSDPPKPRRANPEVPRDLETIILKATARHPEHRYPTAGAMAEDLRRFREDRTILARRTPWHERGWRWCRRNPLVAGLAAAVWLVLAGGTAVSLFYAQRAEDRASDALQARNEAVDARKEGDRKLFESYLSDANATRMSGQPGRRFGALEKVKQALALGDRIELTDADRLAARNIAAAALCQSDLAPGRSWNADALPDDLHPELRAHLRGHVIARSRPEWFGIGATSRDGRFIVTHTAKWLMFGDIPVEVWRVDGSAPVPVLRDSYGRFAVAFSHDGERVAFGHVDGTISVYATATGRLIVRFSTGPGYMWRLAWHPDGHKLAVVGAEQVRVWDTDAQPPVLWAAVPGAADGEHHAAFHPNGRMMLASAVGPLRVWEVPSRRPIEAWQVPANNGMRLSYNRAGDRVIGVGWSNVIRMWDAGSGRELARFAHSDIMGLENGCTSDDTRILGVGKSGDMWFELRVAPGRELRMVDRPKMQLPAGVGVHPGGRLVVLQTTAGLEFIDLHTGRTSVILPPAASLSNTLIDRTGNLWTAGKAKPNCPMMVYRWPVSVDPKAPHRIRCGPPEAVAEHERSDDPFVVSEDASTVAVPRYHRGTLVVRLGPPPIERLIGPQRDVRYTSLSPDGRLLISQTYHMDAGSDIRLKVWDTATGRLLANLPDGHALFPTGYSDDGRWVFASTIEKGKQRKWDLHSVDAQLVPRWEPMPQSHSDLPSPDGRVVAELVSGGTILLRDRATDNELVRLPLPDATGAAHRMWTADGTRLLVMGNEDKTVYIYDLRLIRAGLAEYGLDWDHAPYLPADPAASDPLAPPMEVTLLGTEPFAPNKP